MPHRLRSSLSAVVLVAVLLLGCGGRTKFIVRVDSLRDASPAAEKNSYLLLPANDKELNLDDLQFKEFGAYVQRALKTRGYTIPAKPEDLQVIILMGYGIGEPQTHEFIYSYPIFGQTSGGYSTFNASTYGSGGYANTTGSIQQMPTFGVVGSGVASGSYTTYQRYLILWATDVDEYKKTGKIKTLWKTTITSEGSSDDLRLVFPYMVTAAIPYIGSNTGRKVTVTLKENDKSVLLLTGRSKKTRKKATPTVVSEVQQEEE